MVWHHDPEIKTMCSKLIRGMANRAKLAVKAKGNIQNTNVCHWLDRETGVNL